MERGREFTIFVRLLNKMFVTCVKGAKGERYWAQYEAIENSVTSVRRGKGQ